MDEINIDAENVTVIDGDVDTIDESPFQEATSEDSAEGSAWQEETSEDSSALEAAILVQETLQTQAEQEQAQALEVVAQAATEQVAAQVTAEILLNEQLASINSRLTEIINRMNPPLPETASGLPTPSLEPETETIEATVEVEPVVKERTEPEPDQPSKRASKRGHKWRTKRLR